MAINRWMDNKDVVYIHMEYDSVIKRKNNAIYSNMDGTGDYQIKS